MTNSSLSKRNLCEKNSSETGKPFSAIEKLEQACWNGMLDEFLPGLLLHVEGKTLFMWQIQRCNNFLHVDYCEQPKPFNKEHSIDPYLFLDHLYYN